MCAYVCICKQMSPTTHMWCLIALILQAVIMRYRICTVHVQVERISHWWQQCWSIKDSTFYPENLANSGGQLTPQQPRSEMSWRFLPCGCYGRPQSCIALCWCAGLCVGVCVSECVCVWERKEKGALCDCVCERKKRKKHLLLWSCVCLYAALTSSKRWAGKVLRRVIMHNLWRVHTGVLWVFLFVLAISFSFLFSLSGSHEWNIKYTSVACARFKRAFICILGLMLEGTVITSLDSRHTFLKINMRSIGLEKRFHEYSSGLMWMSATDITVD